MAYIKKLVLQGFKSFPSETGIDFENGMNVIVGPNGSGKSNLADAICFVLGRLSIKSMRAAKAANLIFSGTKLRKPSAEASVKIIFDNSDNVFSTGDKEVAIERIVRRNGQSIYRINRQAKTRQEILEILAKAGIDPYGFNIILQGEISDLVKMHPEERRKIIEEVAGISVYEVRKEKSLRELEKTEERIKEISTILRERSAYLKNLENERQQALKFKQFEKTVERCKASLLKKDIDEKNREKSELQEQLYKKNKAKDEIKIKTEKIKEGIQRDNSRIEEINKGVQRATGLEQETLHNEITNLRAELAGLAVRKEGSENRLVEIQRRKQELENNILAYEKEILELKKKSPAIAKKQDELRKKRDKFAKIEEQRDKIFSMRAELASIKEKINNEKKDLEKIKQDSNSILKRMEELSLEIKSQSYETCEKEILKLKDKIKEDKNNCEKSNIEILATEKKISVAEAEISKLEELKGNIKKIDICPVCKSKITEEHIKHITQDSDTKIDKLAGECKKQKESLGRFRESVTETEKVIQETEKKISEKQTELVKISSLEDKKQELKKVVSVEKEKEAYIKQLEEKKLELERKVPEFSEMQERYATALLEIEEISSRTEDNLDTAISYKERELEKIKNIIRNIAKDEEEISSYIEDISSQIEEKEVLLEKKEKEEKILSEKFKKLFDERTKLQNIIQEQNALLVNSQHEYGMIEESANNMKIEMARINAELESLEIEFKEFKDVEVIKASKAVLSEKLEKAQEALRNIGSVNLRALEVYDSVKKEYEAVNEKVEILLKEKEEILKITEEIDRKKKKTFVKTLESINSFFSANFSQLSAKGYAFLDLENKQEPFTAGLDILLKVGKNKYFDVTSLSGGEQTLVALSLIFAIQQYKPYSFYIFDEIDAALDKRNSEKLAVLFKRHMQKAQYIIITHNDAIITESTKLYGVSMHDGISKILGLEI